MTVLSHFGGGRGRWGRNDNPEMTKFPGMAEEVES